MAGNPDEWPEIIEPGAFSGIDEDVPLRMGSAGPVIGSARVKGTPAGLEVTMKVNPPEDA